MEFKECLSLLLESRVYIVIGYNILTSVKFIFVNWILKQGTTVCRMSLVHINTTETPAPHVGTNDFLRSDVLLLSFFSLLSHFSLLCLAVLSSNTVLTDSVPPRLNDSLGANCVRTMQEQC